MPHRRSFAITLTALVLTACSTSSPGHGTGAGAPSKATVPSTSSSSTSAAPPPTPATSSSAPRPAKSSASTPAPPPRTSSSVAAGAGTYTRRGNPNTWCGSAQLAVSAVDGGAAMSHSGVILRFLNNSHYPCILYGYPGVDGTNRSGRSIEHAVRSPQGYLGGCRCPHPRGVLVRPGQEASAIVEGVAAGGNCAERLHGLLVIAPNTYRSTPFPIAPYGCDLAVHPVVPGGTGDAGR